MQYQRNTSNHKIFIMNTILMGLCLILFIYFFTIQDNFKMKYSFFYNNHSIEPKVSHQGFLVDTSGCQMPEIDPFHPSIKRFYKQVPEEYNCYGKPSFIGVSNSTLYLNENIFKSFYKYLNSSQVTCKYKSIRRNPGTRTKPSDNKVFISTEWSNLIWGKRLDEDAILVTCDSGNNKKVHEEYLPLVRIKKEVEDRCATMDSLNKLNVIFIGIDSISKLNFQRHFRKTRQILRNLNFMEFHGYSKVGDNTFPNIFPMLTGQEPVLLKAESGLFYDHFDFVFKHYAEMGYRTLMVEDAPEIATFNLEKNGFKRPITDYYTRPFSLAVERSRWFKNSQAFCFGSKMENRVFYDYLLDFVDTMSYRPFFAFVYMARLTHDVLNNAGYADLPVYDLLNSLSKRNAFNNSIVAFFSDHGFRFGSIRSTYVGKLEENWPIMHLSFPEWFLTKYPKFAANLNTNTRRLITPYDIHATLVHHLNLINSTVKLNEREVGISLFNEVRENRTCEDAGIASHWCTCRMFERVSVNTSMVRQVAFELVRLVNDMLKVNPQCAELRLKEVFEARVARSNNINKSSVSFKNPEVLVRIAVSPSDAHLESTLRKVEGQLVILGDVSRINRYGNQGDCVNDAVLKKYCYCK